MATKSDVLGHVIKALDDTDPASRKTREAVYAELRKSFEENGFQDLPTAQAVEYLESAIARQELFWLSQHPNENEGDTSDTVSDEKHNLDKKPSFFNRLKSALSRHKKTLPGAGVSWPGTPPGPDPGEATGPFSDHLYFQFPVRSKAGNIFKCRIGYTYDPACDLTATIEDLDFNFQTRAWGMRYALEHLKLAFKALELEAEIAGLAPNAKWENEARDCEAVSLFRNDRLHHVFEKLES